ncbi:MAG: hypothetical protein HY340_00445 [Candidatus Kerfeldbacteria bacterium]|nr:hypothetical protein [Candidatus Kerfeldbacteria bacterium]
MKTFTKYATIAIVGLVLIIAVEDIKWFLFYLLVCLLLVGYQISRQVEFNRKMLRVTRVGTDVKLLALANKLNVNREDIKNIFSGMKQTTNQKDLESLKKDASAVTGAIIIDDNFDL